MSASSRLLCVLALAALAGCPFSFTNEEHCAANDGDAFCASADASKPYCALDGCGLYDEVGNRNGCIAEQPEDLSCYSPCGGKQDANTRSDCEGDTDAGTMGSSGSSSTSGSTAPTTDVPSTTEGGCDCDNPTPICSDGECVACGEDAECEQRFPGKREFCEAEGCVACRSTMVESQWNHAGCPETGSDAPQAPSCVAGECIPWCLFPSDCPGTGCDFEHGLCAPLDNVVHVDGSPGGDAGPGTAEEPFETIAAAVAELGTRGQANFRVGTVLIHQGVYEEELSFSEHTVILRAAEDDNPPVLRSAGAEPLFSVTEASEGASDGRLIAVNLRFEGSPGPLVFLGSGTHFSADGVVMLDNEVVLRSDGGRAFLRNSVIARTVQTPFQFLDDSDVALVATTVIDHPAPLLFDCGGISVPLIVRDSIVGNFDEGLDIADVHSGCTLVDAEFLRSEVGTIGPEGSFKLEDDYELDSDADDVFQITESVGFCAEGTPLVVGGTQVLCPPTEDIDGTPRSPQNWKGFSVP